MKQKILLFFLIGWSISTLPMEMPSTFEQKAPQEISATLLQEAKAGAIDRVRELIATPNAPINIQDPEGMTPLHYAAQHNSQSLVEDLLKLGADINIPNNAGKKPQDLATNPDIIKLLQTKAAVQASYLLSPYYLRAAYEMLPSFSTITGKAKEVSISTVSMLGTGLAKTYSGLLWAGKCALDTGRETLEITAEMLAADDYTDKQAAVRLSKDLPQAEHLFLEKRLPGTKLALEKLLGKELKDEQVPRIAFCFSGGGFRAMIESLGSLIGAENTGLLDSAVYIAGLSGSTWMLNPWIASGLKPSLYKNTLIPKIDKPSLQNYSTQTRQDGKQLLAMLLRKYIDGQYIRPVDFYGAVMFANPLLQGITNNKQSFALSDLVPSINNGQSPLPISTAVTGGRAEENRLWFEFTPFEIGSYELNAFVPTWGFGRTFNNGVSTLPQRPPWVEAEGITGKLLNGLKTMQARQQSLGYLMGLWGSAFAVDFKTTLDEVAQALLQWCPATLHKSLITVLPDMKGSLDTYTQGMLQSYTTQESKAAQLLGTEKAQLLAEALLKESFGAGIVPNITFGIQGAPLSDISELTLVDGGFDAIEEKGKILRVNLALMPLLRPERKLDIIIVCDSSGTLQGAPALRATEIRAKMLGLPFPAIDYATIDTNVIHVFKDDNQPQAPVIIYIPGITNPAYDPNFDPTKADYTGTLNFIYNSDQIKQLSGLTQFTLEQQIDRVKEAINDVIARKTKPSLLSRIFKGIWG
jgi:cytosolic phospholipase A2